MGPRVGELQPRHLDRWRAALVEVIGSSLAFPPFFAHRLGREVTRPLDRATRDAIEQFVRSVNFSALDATEAHSPEVRRFLERLLLRYLEVNPALRGAQAARRAPAMRTRVPKIAADLQRALLDHDGKHVGIAPAARSWQSGAEDGRRVEQRERNTRVLEAVLARGALDQPVAGAFPGAAPTPNGRHHEPAAGQITSPALEPWIRPTDATIPVPAHVPCGGDSASPFASLGGGVQSGMFGVAPSLSERPTGPLPAAPDATQRPSQPLPDDLYQLYGDYLRDLHPEATAARRPAIVATPPPFTGAPQSRRSAAPAKYDTTPYGPPPNGGQPRQVVAAGPDVQIFYQLRYQLEAYVRRAVRGYGVRARADDAFGQLDALRQSGFVDESDLRLAEGILAVTDKVIGAGFASVEDFRQAMMLYLLYHRSHLGS